jgi:hypothetical protein
MIFHCDNQQRSEEGCTWSVGAGIPAFPARSDPSPSCTQVSFTSLQSCDALLLHPPQSHFRQHPIRQSEKKQPNTGNFVVHSSSLETTKHVKLRLSFMALFSKVEPSWLTRPNSSNTTNLIERTSNDLARSIPARMANGARHLLLGKDRNRWRSL